MAKYKIGITERGDAGLALLGLEDKDATALGPQRKDCLCYPGKTELLTHRHPCENGCLYCYWK